MFTLQFPSHGHCMMMFSIWKEMTSSREVSNLEGKQGEPVQQNSFQLNCYNFGKKQVLCFWMKADYNAQENMPYPIHKGIHLEKHDIFILQ